MSSKGVTGREQRPLRRVVRPFESALSIAPHVVLECGHVIPVPRGKTTAGTEPKRRRCSQCPVVLPVEWTA